MTYKEDEYINMELLRFTTAGSVDDGKSTLIGRLLYDSKAIFEDQWDQIETIRNRKGEEHVNLALLTDGLKSEREQGITIDVAYRYFATPKRKFIIADTPGHVQYTRNMVTGASTANLAIILVDARNGIMEQTIRHAYIASLLQIPHVVICVNKMDLVNFDQKIFDSIQKDFSKFSSNLSIKDVRFVPISALNGDNVVDKSTNLSWYKGPTLMYLLENIDIGNDYDYTESRFPVQYVIRPQSDEYHDYRGYGGRIAGGTFSPGDEVVILPNNIKTKIKSIDFGKEQLDVAIAPQSVTIQLDDDVDISRGDMIADANSMPRTGNEIEVMACWLSEKSMVPGGKYILRHTTQEVRCIISSVDYKIDINTLDKNTKDTGLGLNEIAKVRIKTTKPIYHDSYRKNRITGSVCLVDEGTFNTVCAGMII